MWHTNNGDRTLEGAEARLFAEALWNCISMVENAEGDCYLGPPVFERLTYGQKVSLLSIVGNGLLASEQPICMLNAAVEGAISAVFEYIKTIVLLEIDELDIGNHWRKMVLAARSEAGAKRLPNENCEDEEEWLIQIEELSYLILWDYDFEDEDLYMDIPPEDSSRLKEFMRIKDDYFIVAPDDLDEKEIGAALSELKALCQEICEK